jgi:hypothetical protein
MCWTIETLHQHFGLSLEQAYEKMAADHGLSAHAVKVTHLKWRKRGHDRRILPLSKSAETAVFKLP